MLIGVTFRFADLLPVQHLLDLIVILKNCVTGLYIAKKSRVVIFIVPCCGCHIHFSVKLWLVWAIVTSLSLMHAGALQRILSLYFLLQSHLVATEKLVLMQWNFQWAPCKGRDGSSALLGCDGGMLLGRVWQGLVLGELSGSISVPSVCPWLVCLVLLVKTVRRAGAWVWRLCVTGVSDQAHPTGL